MNKLSNWIKNHQVVSFFFITFAITWGLGFSYGAVLIKVQFLLAPLVMVATCGPALAGIIVSAVSDIQPRQGSRKTFWIAFLAAWVVSALVLLAYNTFINRVPLSFGAAGFTLIVVVPVAFVISMAYARIPAVKSYMSSLVRLRGLWGWALLALVLIPGPALLSIPVSNIIGRQPIVALWLPRTGLALVSLIAVKFIYQIFFFNAVGEEAGWRGFALPRLQARTSPLIAALIISIFWAPWHFFLWQAEGALVLTLQFWVEMYMGITLLSVFIVWICNRAKGNILVAGIAHAAINTAFDFMVVHDRQRLNLVWLVIALVLILIDRMWKKLPPDHPAVYTEPLSVSLMKDAQNEILEVYHV